MALKYIAAAAVTTAMIIGITLGAIFMPVIAIISAAVGLASLAAIFLISYSRSKHHRTRTERQKHTAVTAPTTVTVQSAPVVTRQITILNTPVPAPVTQHVTVIKTPPVLVSPPVVQVRPMIQPRCTREVTVAADLPLHVRVIEPIVKSIQRAQHEPSIPMKIATSVSTTVHKTARNDTPLYVRAISPVLDTVKRSQNEPSIAMKVGASVTNVVNKSRYDDTPTSAKVIGGIAGIFKPQRR